MAVDVYRSFQYIVMTFGKRAIGTNSLITESCCGVDSVAKTTATAANVALVAQRSKQYKLVEKCEENKWIKHNNLLVLFL